VTADAAHAPVLEVSDLRVELASGRPVVEDVSIRLAAGEALGLVGESGSGKTTTALAMVGFARPGMRIAGGTVTMAGERVDLARERAARAVRGRLASHVPQDPATCLNPSLRIGSFIDDVLAAHQPGRVSEGSAPAALGRVQLPATREFGRRFPHQLSGGQQQRVLIASALVCEPPLVIFDEPTTGLDVVTQARVLEEIRGLHRERGLAIVYVSHDLAVISEIADRVAVMYAGRIVEEGPTAAVLTRPRHPYTRGLVESIPDYRSHRVLHAIAGVAVGVDERPAGCAFAPRCPQRVDKCQSTVPGLDRREDGRAVRCFEADRTPALTPEEPSHRRRAAGEPVLVVENLSAVHKGRGTTVVAAQHICFEVEPAGCVALVGESGSGKTTIARTIAGLHPRAGGTIRLGGDDLPGDARHRPRDLRRRCQIIFQNPYESLNPRQRVGEQISRPARILCGLSKSEAAAETRRLLTRVRLPERLASKFPSELSGGERQRVAIARALAAKPEVLICDEITSALDVSVQAAVIDLLRELRETLGLALVFITHNLGVVNTIADRVLILDHGVICEQGNVDSVFSSPQHPRTQELLSCAPSLSRLDPVRVSTHRAGDNALTAGSEAGR
jgi:peptide/nickel transport system ATP-binding protein